MVRVFYEPPPHGPATDLNRSGYGVKGGGLFKSALERVSRINPLVSIPVCSIGITALCYIPFRTCVVVGLYTYAIPSLTHSPVFHKLPFTMEPEYQAAQRAYMRYHNMNPIFGISSK